MDVQEAAGSNILMDDFRTDLQMFIIARCRTMPQCQKGTKV